MRTSAIRTVVILACGVVMALIAYVGQAGDAPIPVGSSIRLVVVNGLRLDYRLTTPEPEASQAAPELVLYLAGPGRGGAEEAVVIYRILGPRGTELQAWARPGRGGYEADVHLEFPGRYQIAVEIIAASGTFNDRFEYYRP